MIGTLRPADDHTPLEGIPAFFQAPPPSRFRSHIETHDNLSGSEAERFNDPDAAVLQSKKTMSLIILVGRIWTQMVETITWPLDLSLLLHTYNVVENDQISIPSLILLLTEEQFISSAIIALKNIRKAEAPKIFEIISPR